MESSWVGGGILNGKNVVRMKNSEELVAVLLDAQSDAPKVLGSSFIDSPMNPTIIRTGLLHWGGKISNQVNLPG